MKYYSEDLKQLFSTEKELKEAEKAAIEKEKKKKELAEKAKKEAEILKKERADAAKEVENAFKAIKEAEDEYYKKLNAFIEKYGYYHYSSKDANDFPSVLSLFKPFFTSWL